MKIEVKHIETGVVSMVLTPCRYHMADGTINYYYQTGKGQLQ